MKKKYQIQIQEGKIRDLASVMKLIDVTLIYDGLGWKDESNVIHQHFVVELTKYELLFVRLACSAGMFKEL